MIKVEDHATHCRRENTTILVMDRFSVDEVTVSVEEELGKSVSIDRDNLACLYRGFGVRKRNR